MNGESGIEPGTSTNTRAIGGVCLSSEIWRTNDLEAAGYVEGEMEPGAEGTSPAFCVRGGICARRNGR